MTVPDAIEDAQKNGLDQLYMASWNVKLYSCAGKNWQFLTKPNMQLLYSSAIALLDIHPREMEICSHKNVYINVYNTFLHNSPKLQQPQCLLNKL